MRKQTLTMIGAAAAAALVLTGCSSDSSDSADSDSGSSDDSFSIVSAINSPLGDGSFFDDAETGLQQLKSEGYDVADTLQAAANDPAQWKANLESVSTGEYDLVVTGSAQMNDILTEAAEKFPDQKYVFYDDVVDAPNVASLTYKQNEGSFLAGVLAAIAVSQPEDFPLAEGATSVGVVGGMDIPVINDFIVGFEKGVESVDPDMEVQVAYVGDFVDSNAAADLTKGMYADGAGVVFQVAGGAGAGVLQAAKDENRYAIGVDKNQNAEQPGFILASMLKNVGVSLVDAAAQAKDGTLAYGKTTTFGLADGGVGLNFDDNEGIVPDAVIEQIQEYEDQVISGEIEVPTAF